MDRWGSSRTRRRSWPVATAKPRPAFSQGSLLGKGLLDWSGSLADPRRLGQGLAQSRAGATKQRDSYAGALRLLGLCRRLQVHEPDARRRNVSPCIRTRVCHQGLCDHANCSFTPADSAASWAASNVRVSLLAIQQGTGPAFAKTCDGVCGIDCRTMAAASLEPRNDLSVRESPALARNMLRPEI